MNFIDYTVSPPPLLRLDYTRPATTHAGKGLTILFTIILMAATLATGKHDVLLRPGRRNARRMELCQEGGKS